VAGQYCEEAGGVEGVCCQPCPYWRATWSKTAVPDSECVAHGPGHCCVPPDFPYSVGVYNLSDEDIRKDYVDYYGAAQFPRCLSDAGYSCAPSDYNIDERTDPVIAVCTTDPVGPGFPRPESILAFVVASRLRAHGGAVVGLFPMGLTKMPLGYGLDYEYDRWAYPRDLIDTHYVQPRGGAMSPAHGRPWARDVAPRMFRALMDAHPDATLMTRVHTVGFGVNKLVARMARTEEYRGRISIGFAQYISTLSYGFALHGIWMLIRGWFPKLACMLGDDLRLVATTLPDGNCRVDTVHGTPGFDMMASARALGGLQPGQSLVVLTTFRVLSVDDVGLLQLMAGSLASVSGANPALDAIPEGLVPSRLRINHMSAQVSVDGDWCASFHNMSTLQEILRGDRVWTGLGMLFCIYPREKE
jgi:hypothetical protein